MQIKIRFSDNSEGSVEVPDSGTVLDIKQELVNLEKGTHVAQFRIIFMGMVIEDSQTLIDSGLKDGSLIHVQIRDAPAEVQTQEPVQSNVVPNAEIQALLKNSIFLGLMKRREFVDMIKRFVDEPSLADNIGSTDTMTSSPGDFRTLYSNQLDQMQMMGFEDINRNIEFLQRANGNVNEAIESMLMA